MRATFSVRVYKVTRETKDVLSFDLRPMSPSAMLPPFSAGAHINIHLPQGVVRSYSLTNNSSETYRYEIAVLKNQHSRGGSRHMHEIVRAGDILTISEPYNSFPLEERARHSIFIAGGIGITALWCMIQRLELLGASWELYFACRSREQAALLDRINALKSSSRKSHIFLGDDPASPRLDIAQIVREALPDAHLYCCGPTRMLDAFQVAAQVRPFGTTHVEYFVPQQNASVQGGFSVELIKSGLTVDVKVGESILDALLNAGMIVPYSCRQGTCGCCEVKVIEGIPDHRDQVLSEAEKNSNESIFVCCSGAKTSRLVLDL